MRRPGCVSGLRGGVLGGGGFVRGGYLYSFIAVFGGEEVYGEVGLSCRQIIRIWNVVMS